MPASRLRVAWATVFPIEWLPELPPELRLLPKLHPATWQRVLLDELKTRPDLELHVIAVRKHFPRHLDFEWEGVEFHCLKVPPGMRTLSLFWWDTLLVRSCLHRIQPDLVHAWGTERGAALVASRLAYPYLVTMQGLLEWYVQQVQLSRFTRLEARLEKVALRRASIVSTESRFGVNWLREHYKHLDVQQIEHAPSWIFHRLQRHPETRPVRFLFVGPMSQLKGTDLLLAGLDRLRTEIDFRLTIVGSGAPAYVDRMKSITSSALWQRITIRSGLTPAQVAEEVACATIMVFPTRADTSPNCVKEAVVAGLPVVASAVGGIPDYVVPGRNGLTFAAGDLDAFTQAVRTAVAHPHFAQGKVDAATLEQMRAYLSPKVMSEKFLAAYQRVLERKGKF